METETMRFDQVLTAMLTRGKAIRRIGSDDYYILDNVEDIPVIWHYIAEKDDYYHASFTTKEVLAVDWEIKS